jgi:Dockerin type I domain
LAESWSWNNKENKLDSNADGNITSVDALLTINLLNSGYVGKNLAELDRLYEQGVIDQVDYLDCNNDGYISALDALMVINHLNQERIAAAEAAVMLEGEREKRRKRV